MSIALERRCFIVPLTIPQAVLLSVRMTYSLECPDFLTFGPIWPDAAIQLSFGYIKMPLKFERSQIARTPAHDR